MDAALQQFSIDSMTLSNWFNDMNASTWKIWSTPLNDSCFWTKSIVVVAVVVVGEKQDDVDDVMSLLLLFSLSLSIEVVASFCVMDKISCWSEIYMK